MTEYNGILPVKKPSGPTSHDVVDRVRRIYGMRRVGHTGTLDPRASGLLLLCLGKSTKVTQFLSRLDKTYDATILLGTETTTGDTEGEIVRHEDSAPIEEERLANTLTEFQGKIEQQVPAYSAVKVGGRRLYKLAREGAEVPIVRRHITIYDLRLLKYEHPYLTISVRCSGGTYIRVLAEDIGRSLGCGGTLSTLVRTHVGKYAASEAYDLEEVAGCSSPAELDRLLLPVGQFLDYPLVLIGEGFSRAILDGRKVLSDWIVDVIGNFEKDDRVLLCDSQHRALAVGTSAVTCDELRDRAINGWFRYERVLI